MHTYTHILYIYAHLSDQATRYRYMYTLTDRQRIGLGVMILCEQLIRVERESNGVTSHTEDVSVTSLNHEMMQMSHAGFLCVCVKTHKHILSWCMTCVCVHVCMHGGVLHVYVHVHVYVCMYACSRQQ